MSKDRKTVPAQNEIKLGQATYVVERVFGEKHTVSDLLANKIIHDKEKNTQPNKYENVG